MKTIPMSIMTLCATAALAALACAKDAATQPRAQQSQPAAVTVSGGRVEMAVTGEGFVPAQVKVRAGQPLTLVVTRKTDRTCATEIVIKDYGINQPLPLNKAVEVTFTPTKPGKVRYACAMDMIAGELVVE